jgi:hypothetical protein
MKNLKGIAGLLLLLLFSFSCSKDGDDNKDPNAAVRESISAKWNVSDVTGRISSQAYESFEFNKSGNYIIVVDGTVLFGLYEILDDKSTLQLEDFGTIKILSVNENAISFTLTLNGDDTELTVTAVKADEMASSTKTELLCKTWQLVTMNGDPVAGTEYDLTVLFSAAGTYFVSYNDPGEGESEGGLALWAWKDSSEETLCYSWDGFIDCDGEHEVQIVELTKSKLKIIEQDLTYVLEPASETGRRPTGSVQAGRAIKKGFFSK